jgi:hypothetical protein
MVPVQVALANMMLLGVDGLATSSGAVAFSPGAGGQIL